MCVLEKGVEAKVVAFRNGKRSYSTADWVPTFQSSFKEEENHMT